MLKLGNRVQISVAILVDDHVNRPRSIACPAPLIGTMIVHGSTTVGRAKPVSVPRKGTCSLAITGAEKHRRVRTAGTRPSLHRCFIVSSFLWKARLDHPIAVGAAGSHLST